MNKILNMFFHWMDVFYNKYYPMTIINRIRSRKRNKNKNFSLLVGNCLGGYVYHQLGLKFNSPTINLMIHDDDFFKIVSKPSYYLSQEITPFVDPDYPNVPSGKIDDVIIHFTHYKTVEEGEEYWNKRKKRINWDNLSLLSH